MTQTQHEKLVILVKSLKAGEDPSIKIYHIEVLEDSQGLWTETFGSMEQLRAYMRGLQVALRLTGWFIGGLDWMIPDRWSEPSQMRWTITKTDIPIVEELTANGTVIEI